MSSTMTKLGFLSFVATALAVPLARPQSDNTIDDSNVAPNAWWSVPTVETPGNYPTTVVVVTATVTNSPSATAVAAADFSSHSHHHHRTSKKSSSSSPATTAKSTPSSSAIPAFSSSAVSTPEAPTSTTSLVPKSSSAAPTGSKSSSGKRGIPYNNADLTDCFENTKVSWAFNWGSDASGLNTDDFEFVAELWGTGSEFTSSWSANAKSALGKGTKHLMAFNEADLSSQSNLSPAAAASAYKQYMMPFADDAKLGSPSVTNGGGDMGLTWLGNFIDACDDCQIDFCQVHWYDSYSNIAYFKSHLQDAYNTCKKPIWLTEFGTTDGDDDQISGFIKEVTEWMDDQDFIERYAYFMASPGKLISGTSLSNTGKTYATA